MPGKRITDHQLIKYKEIRGNRTQEAAAAKTGISVSSARRIKRRGALPSQRGGREIGAPGSIRWRRSGKVKCCRYCEGRQG